MFATLAILLQVLLAMIVSLILMSVWSYLPVRTEPHVVIAWVLIHVSVSQAMKVSEVL